MSRAFPDSVKCPYCGLMVAASNKKGRMRAHARQAAAAGIDGPCLRDGMTAPLTYTPEHEAQPDPDSALPRHLRGD